MAPKLTFVSDFDIAVANADGTGKINLTRGITPDWGAQPATTVDCAAAPPLGAILGTAGIDIIKGTSGDGVIFARGGPDLVNGLGGDDTICGGAGIDALTGAAGDDVLDGGTGLDICVGGPGADTAVACGVSSSIP